jgi:predicted dithiol-disulfide oxidoreductase (DUF899 family)
MGRIHEKTFPGETAEYRDARDNLLEAELALRKQTEAVAEMRRSLPNGGAVSEDYEFVECGSNASRKLSELFADGKNSLIVYSLMYGPEAENACPACTSLLDGLNGISPHVADQTNFVVVAKSPSEKIQSWADGRGWGNLRLLSSNTNSYNTDYFTEDEKDNQWPCINVFKKSGDSIYHYWAAELLFASDEENQDARHADSIWPLWNMFDLTPDGRPGNWYPKFSYD